MSLRHANCAILIVFFIQPGFIPAFWAPDIFPFCFNGYFLKPAMLFAYKLINWHAELPGENITPPHVYFRPDSGISLEAISRPNIFVGASFQILDSQQVACGLKLGPRAPVPAKPRFSCGEDGILNKNPILRGLVGFAGDATHCEGKCVRGDWSRCYMGK